MQTVMGKLMRIFLFATLNIFSLINCYSQAHEKHSYWPERKVDSCFVAWNKATLNSIQQRINSANQSPLKDSYKNRLNTFNGYLDIADSSKVNKTSIRYKFLKQLTKSIVKNDIFIIEANKSGMSVSIRTFVLFFKDSGKVDLDIYAYQNEDWAKLGSISNVPILLNRDLSKYYTEFQTGSNSGDIIVTHLWNQKIHASTYFLYGTISGTWPKELQAQWDLLKYTKEQE
jgi:hypothetical protein